MLVTYDLGVTSVPHIDIVCVYGKGFLSMAMEGDAEF